MTVHFDTLNAAAELEAHTLGAEHPANPTLYGRFGKRFVDTVIVLATLPVLLPVMAVIWFAIWITCGKPVYAQKRVGRDGRVFTMLKFRTMVINADEMLQAHLAACPDSRREWDLNQKLRHDPRITRIGHLLRKTSMDELPQFLNVLWGNMAIVGPRPMMLEQQSLYPGREYYTMRPGITGLWQISDRNDCTFGERARFDGIYSRTMSLRQDLSIIIKTVGVVLRGTGC